MAALILGTIFAANIEEVSPVVHQSATVSAAVEVSDVGDEVDVEVADAQPDRVIPPARIAGF